MIYWIVSALVPEFNSEIVDGIENRKVNEIKGFK